jgi:drug/metabolite transporter (DMT)-like permease
LRIGATGRPRVTGGVLTKFQLTPNVRGALWMIAAAILFTINAAVVKQLGATGIDSFQTTFVRSAAGLLLILPFFLWRRGILNSRNIPLQIMQAVAGTIALLSHFYAWTKLPLTDVTTLLFTQALFVLVLAVVVLGEVVHWRRWAATMCGFAGAVLMVRPTFSDVNIDALFALFAAFCISLQLVLIAKLPQGEKELTMLFYLGAIGTLITAAPGLHVWKTPTETQTILLVCNGVLGVSNQACVFRAFRVGDAAYVAPFDYSKLIVAVLLGLIWFGEIPSLWTTVGGSIIILSTLYVSKQERN